MKTPDFFVVGGSSCGTTALCTYLTDHPNICFARTNHELHVLGHEDECPEIEGMAPLMPAAGRKYYESRKRARPGRLEHPVCFGKAE
jgi:hypothetical protein